MSTKRKNKPPQPQYGNIMFFVALAIFGVLGMIVVTRKPKAETPSPVATTPAKAPVQAASTLQPSTNLPVAKAEEEATDVDKATEHVQMGNQLLAQNKVTEAVEEYRKAVKLNPDDEDTHYNLGLALAKLGQIEEAK